jgi:putative endopeptidase
MEGTLEHTPQSNFYLWQNKKWLDDPANDIPADYTSWGGFMKLRDNSLKQQNEILKELENKDNLLENEKKMVIIYQKALQKYLEWDNDKGNYNELGKELSKLSEIVNDDPVSLATYGGYCHKNGIQFICDFDKGSDMKNVNDVILDLSPGNLSLPTRDYYFDDKFQKQRDFFVQHLNNVYDLLKNNSIQLSQNFVSNVFEFEKKIAYIKMTKAQTRLYDEYFTKTNLVGVYENMKNHNFVKHKLDNYDVSDKIISFEQKDKDLAKQFMETIYGCMELKDHMKNNFNKNFPNQDKSKAYNLSIYDGDYFVRLFKLLNDPSNIQLCFSWLQYNIIKSMNEYCTKQLNDEFFDFYNRKLGGQNEQKSHEKRAVGAVNVWVGELLGKNYVNKYFPQESKDDIIQMIDKVINIMNESLKNNDWLTSKTKENALLKLSSFNKKIGFPDIWKDYSLLKFDDNHSLYEIKNKVKQFNYVTEFLNKINTHLDKNEWFMTPQTANAYFHPQLNEIVFPAAILQPPFYQNTYESIDMNIQPKEYYEQFNFNPLVPINHGGIMGVIAHEITHGYDDQGRKFDHKGNMKEWWTKEDIELFVEKTKIMAEQVNRYKYVDNEKKVHTMNADLTMGENLADLGGLTLALKAMLKDKVYEHPESIKLFFRSWGNVWKAKFKEETRIDRLVSDPHAPTDFRGNLVKNIDLFHQVFDVKEGDDMWLEPENRVRMW